MSLLERINQDLAEVDAELALAEESRRKRPPSIWFIIFMMLLVPPPFGPVIYLVFLYGFIKWLVTLSLWTYR
jgi:hypothetical protein